MNWTGALLGLCTFIVIGVFHPIVIKTEYHFGTRLWWVFLLAGLAFTGAALYIDSTFFSPLSAITGFSCFWSILELFEQKKRVERGWFPKKPKQ